MAFNPDAYLKQKAAEAPKQGFDPDQYLASKSAPEEQESGTWESIKGAGSAFMHGLGAVAEYPAGILRKAIDYPATGQWPDEAPSMTKVLEDYGVERKPFSPVTQSMISQVAAQGPQLGLLGLPSEEGSPAHSALKQGLATTSKTDILGPPLEIAADPLMAAGAVTKIPGVVKGAQMAARGTKAAISGVGRLGLGMTDMVTGSRIASESAGAAKDVVKSVVNQIKAISSPRTSIDWGKHLQTAKANGINPDALPLSVKHGREAYPARLERVARDFGMESETDRLRLGLDQVNAGIDKSVQKVAGGAPLGHADAGDVLSDAWKAGESKLHDSLELTYSTVPNLKKTLVLDAKAAKPYATALDGAEKEATRLMNKFNALEKGSGKALFDITQDLKSATTVKEQIEQLRSLGKLAFDERKYTSVGQVPPDMAKMQDLYFKLREAVIGTVEAKAGAKTAAQLRKNNEVLSQFLTEKKRIYPTIGRDVAPEKVYQRLVLNGDTKTLQALKNTIDPSEMNKLKGSFLNDMIAKNADGEILYAKTARNLQKNQERVKILFEPDELKNVTNLIELGQDFGPAINPGSAPSNALREMFGDPVKASMYQKALDLYRGEGRGSALVKAVKETPKGLIKTSEKARKGTIVERELGKAAREKIKGPKKEDEEK